MVINISDTVMPEENQSSDKVYLGNLPLAMSYVPFQVWGKTYDLNQALQVGTLFPDLDFAFEGKRIGGARR
jgi:hypothetical protein